MRPARPRPPGADVHTFYGSVIDAAPHREGTAAPAKRRMKQSKLLNQASKSGYLKRIADDSVMHPSLRRFPAKRLREFLVGLANTRAAPGDVPGWERFVRSFQDFFPPRFCDVFSKDFPGDRKEILATVAELRDRVRFAWNEKDGEAREWRIYVLRDVACTLIDPTDRLTDEELRTYTLPAQDFDETPPRDALQQALIYLGRRARSSRVCEWDDCDQEKYFLATQPNQRYCTDVCALEAQRKRKMGSWEHYGKDWREKRKKGKKR